MSFPKEPSPIKWYYVAWDRSGWYALLITKNGVVEYVYDQSKYDEVYPIIFPEEYMTPEELEVVKNRPNDIEANHLRYQIIFNKYIQNRNTS